jgi:3-dehydroquinate dehydratase/shikimate dehydrogenase
MQARARSKAQRRLPPVVICSILERTVDRMLDSAAAAPPGCALIEIRADHLRSEEIAEVVHRVPRDVIVTIRRRSEGGAYFGSEHERRRGLVAALQAGARFVDVEWQSSIQDLASGEHRDRVIFSHHGTECELEDLLSIYRSMAGSGAARVKLVAETNRPRDMLAVRDALSETGDEGTPLACFAMGRSGAISRILAPAWGSWATYGSLDSGRETAPGQFSARDLLETYDALSIGSQTRLFALLGNAVFGSPSPAMHRAAYRACGLDARYLPLELDSLAELAQLSVGERGLSFEALAVTIPFKEAAARLSRLDDDVSRAALAVNTVIVGDEGWTGYNTDGPALLDLVREHLEPATARIAIVGAGGTARAAAAALRGAGAQVTLFNRTRARADEVAARTDCEARDLAALAQSRWDVLLQATPLGKGGERVVEARQLRGRLVIDAVYGCETPLIEDARAIGLDVACGFDLLVAQAVLQFERMTGLTIEAEVMRRAGQEWLTRRAADPPNGSACAP